MRFPEAEILVMARAPVAGKAKTRLIPALGEEGAAQLHSYLVERLLHNLSQARVAPITLCCTPDTEHPFFLRCRDRYSVHLQPQRGRDLGERLQFALQDSLARNTHAVVVGCDIPELGAKDISAAIQALQQGSDAALSPTEDGGYALLGLNKVVSELFAGVEWGSERVMSQTRQRLDAINWDWQELPWQWDVDRPEDLRRLTQLELPPLLTALLHGGD